MIDNPIICMQTRRLTRRQAGVVKVTTHNVYCTRSHDEGIGVGLSSVFVLLLSMTSYKPRIQRRSNSRSHSARKSLSAEFSTTWGGASVLKDELIPAAMLSEVCVSCVDILNRQSSPARKAWLWWLSPCISGTGVERAAWDHPPRRQNFSCIRRSDLSPNDIKKEAFDWTIPESWIGHWSDRTEENWRIS